jgi:hypothetical protein
MASNAALRVADIVDEIMSLTNKTNSQASIKLAAHPDDTFDFQLITMGKSEQFGSISGVESYLAALKAVIGNESDKEAAFALVHNARERRRLEKDAANIAAQLAALPT